MNRTIPGTDLSVSRMCFGTANFGDTVGEADAFRLLDYYAARGGNFIDTANVYGKWVTPAPSNHSERIIGRWLKARGSRGRVVLATKGGHPDLASMQTPRLNRTAIHADWEESARCLGTDVIDFYWLHRDDEALPVGEIVEILEDMRRAGRIRFFGFSNYRAARVQAALEYAAAHGIDGISGVQNRWSLARVNDKEVSDRTLVCMDGALYALLTANPERLAAISYTASGGGVFSLWAAGAHKNAPPASRAVLYDNPLNRKRLDALRRYAAERNTPIGALVLAWQMHQPFTAIPVSATSRTEHVDEMMAACEISLSAGEVAALNAGETY